ncbi:GNAT family N-acetyltransferase [Streptococcus jiangjianxini]|uniref:GNAT family N-acetyltransferase n=1 Tax=Streptococcus jiangjianxini TaxID=3161189 RepID=UPI0032F02416
MMIRPIQSADNAQMAEIIRASLKAVGLDKPGTAYFDPSLDDLAGAYHQDTKSAYLIACDNDCILGGAGFGKITETTCELQKLYVTEKARNKGIGRRLLEQVICLARKADYDNMYLETTDVLAQAVNLYENLGFEQLDSPLANDNGHHAMTIWMLKDLKK